MILAALNGRFGKDLHAALPCTPEELARDVSECLEVGARNFHIHVRDAQGVETLAPAVVNRTVATARGGNAVAVGVTAGTWIGGNLDGRLRQISGWREVDHAKVNVSEPGFERVMELLATKGIGVEAGVSTVADVLALSRSGLAS